MIHAVSIASFGEASHPACKGRRRDSMKEICHPAQRRESAGYRMPYLPTRCFLTEIHISDKTLDENSRSPHLYPLNCDIVSGRICTKDQVYILSKGS